MEMYNPETIQTLEITFSLRDLKLGAELLTRLGLRKEGLAFSETFIIKVEDWMIPDLEFELRSSGLEFEMWY